ncbi:hypothetical protein [Citrobacter freundii complex sp. CFNIH2]|nr:hypothetical protein [Citrobacter freundii complex sp. CFNIH2]
MTEKLSETHRVLVEQSRVLLESWPQAIVIVLTGILLWVFTRPRR